MRWLITGGCGFIGRNLAAWLLERGEGPIRIYDNLTVGSREDLRFAGAFSEATPQEAAQRQRQSNTKLQLVTGDILDAAAMAAACEDIDVIVHLAANTGVDPSVKNPRFDCETNVMGTLNVLEGARAHSVKRFVFASSGAPVGECEPPIHEEKVPHPVSPYGASKLAGEAYCSAYFRTFGIETVALRFGNVYGVGSDHKNSLVAKFIKQALAGETLEVYGDGKQTRDFIFVHDLLEAILAAAIVAGVGGEIFQIATQKETTVGEVTAALCDALVARGFARPAIVHGPLRVGDVRRNYSDTSKALKMLNWQARTALPDGLGKTIEWFLRSRPQ